MIEYEPHEVIEMQQGALKDSQLMIDYLVKCNNRLESRNKALARIVYCSSGLTIGFSIYSLFF